jgi:hypothetical protein
MMTVALRLTIGNKYDVTTLVALPVGEWIDPSDTISGYATGYSYLDWFRDGVYLGPDEDGVEPLFEVQ